MSRFILIVWEGSSGRSEIRRIQRSFRDSEFVGITSKEFRRSSSNGEFRRIDRRRRAGVSGAGYSVHEKRYGSGIFHHGEMEPLSDGKRSDVRESARVVVYFDLIRVRVYVEFACGSSAAGILEQALVRISGIRHVVPSFYGHVARSEIEIGCRSEFYGVRRSVESRGVSSEFALCGRRRGFSVYRHGVSFFVSERLPRYFRYLSGRESSGISRHPLGYAEVVDVSAEFPPSESGRIGPDIKRGCVRSTVVYRRAS